MPDRVILSGSVSIMKEVQSLVAEVFGVKPDVIDDQICDVSVRLAYILGEEVKEKTQRF